MSMGKRCQSAALGATIALLVAACAATDSSTEPDSAIAPSESPTTTVQESVQFPDSLADASFIQPATTRSCAAGEHSQISLLNPADGSLRWSLPLPRPGNVSVNDASTAYVAFTWDGGQNAGVGAVDLTAGAPRWQRFLSSEPEQMRLTQEALVVVTRDDIRALDLESGEDLWVNDSQFDFSSVVVTPDQIFAIDSVGVHAIDLNSGEVIWQLVIQRPDTVAADQSTLAVSAGTRLIAVDLDRQTRLWDINVDRLGSGELYVGENSVSYELSPTVAPGGGTATLDRASGVETWRSTSIGEPTFASGDLVIASTANSEPAPAAPFIVFGVHASSSERRWQIPSTAPLAETLVSVSRSQILIREPHEAFANLSALRLIDIATGATIWEHATDLDIDGARIGLSGAVTLFGTAPRLGADRGVILARNSAGDWWTTSTTDGVFQPPLTTPGGLAVVSGERTPICLGRTLGEPTGDAPVTEVLGASQTN